MSQRAAVRPGPNRGHSTRPAWSRASWRGRGSRSGDPARGSCDDAADASLAPDPSRAPRRFAALAGLAALAATGRRTWTGPDGAADARRRSSSAGRSSPCRRSGSCSRSAGGCGRCAGSTRPTPRTRCRAAGRSPSSRHGRARVRAAVRDRAVRHDAVLGPHGPAHPADAGRRAAPRPRRPDHAGAAVGAPATRRRWILPVLHSRVMRVLAHPVIAWLMFAAMMWASPLLAAVRRGARGPARPRHRARPVPGRRAPLLVAGGRARSGARGGWATRSGSAISSCR